MTDKTDSFASFYVKANAAEHLSLFVSAALAEEYALFQLCALVKIHLEAFGDIPDLYCNFILCHYSSSAKCF